MFFVVGIGRASGYTEIMHRTPLSIKEGTVELHLTWKMAIKLVTVCVCVV